MQIKLPTAFSTKLFSVIQSSRKSTSSTNKGSLPRSISIRIKTIFVIDLIISKKNQQTLRYNEYGQDLDGVVVGVEIEN